MRFSDVQQQVYWTRRQEAKRHFLANEIELGLEICVELDEKPDLNDFLRALINVDVVQYTDFPYDDKMSLIEKYYTLVAGMEQTMGEDDNDLNWLKSHFERVKRELDLSRASPELGDEHSVSSEEAVSSENDKAGGFGDDEKDGPEVDEMDDTEVDESDDSGDDEMDESEDHATDDTEEDAMDENEDEVDDPGQAAMPTSMPQATQYGETGPWEGFND